MEIFKQKDGKVFFEILGSQDSQVAEELTK